MPSPAERENTFFVEAKEGDVFDPRRLPAALDQRHVVDAAASAFLVVNDEACAVQLLVQLVHTSLAVGA